VSYLGELSGYFGQGLAALRKVQGEDKGEEKRSSAPAIMSSPSFASTISGQCGLPGTETSFWASKVRIEFRCVYEREEEGAEVPHQPQVVRWTTPSSPSRATSGQTRTLASVGTRGLVGQLPCGGALGDRRGTVSDRGRARSFASVARVSEGPICEGGPPGSRHAR
jgi:hypothetical protein